MKFRYVSVFFGCLFAVAPQQAMEDIELRKQRAAQATQGLLQQLGAALTAEMKQGGPVRAITVCRDLAPNLAGSISLANGWRVTRVGTRVRNPLLGTPDAWEQRVLGEFVERAAKGETYAEMVHSEVVDEPDGRYFRFMKAIGVMEKCLACHGEASQVPAEVRMRLASEYPMDQAVDYTLGDLRGAVSVKQPLSIPLAAEP